MSIANSQHWYRVANLKPKLHSHIQIHRHDYRGLIWYIMEDQSTGRNHRFNPAAYQFIGLLDGKLSVQEISDLLDNELGEFSPSQDEIVQILGQLHSADLIQSDVLVNTEELFERQARLQQTKFSHRLLNPISQQLALWDPDDFLNKYAGIARFLFTRWMAMIWLILVGFSAIKALSSWQDISNHFAINALNPRNLLILFLLYAPLKILHELSHAFATKLNGGEVHEMGVNFLLFMPVPYVNVSSANHFRDKYDRMLVSSAGILVDTFGAALGLLLFLSSEAGLVQDIAFNIFLTGGISSLFFNGNPLLKYDGYYLLADALGIPNLYQRSSQYWHYFFQRYLFGLRHTVSPATARGETVWFILYSISSLLYRLSILWFICVYVTEKFFLLGIILALWLSAMQILLPGYHALRFILTSHSLGRKKKRALIGTSLIACVLLSIIGFIPFPSYTIAEGIVWLPDKAQIKAERDGFIENLQVRTNQFVKEGDEVVTMNDETLLSQAKIARAKVGEMQSQYRAQREADLVKADILKHDLGVAQAELENITEKTQAMVVKALKNGKVLIPDADDLPGQYIRHGELIGYILDGGSPVIRVAVPQDNIGQLREHVKDIKIRMVNAPDEEYEATILRQAPEATYKLPSPALATIGGGRIPVDPKNVKEALTLQRIFLVDLKFHPKNNNIPIGARVFVRLNHGGETLFKQWYRRIRQTFLRQFNV